MLFYPHLLLFLYDSCSTSILMCHSLRSLYHLFRDLASMFSAPIAASRYHRRCFYLWFTVSSILARKVFEMEISFVGIFYLLSTNHSLLSLLVRLESASIMSLSEICCLNFVTELFYGTSWWFLVLLSSLYLLFIVQTFPRVFKHSIDYSSYSHFCWQGYHYIY